MKAKYIEGKLTVVFRNDGPMVHCGDCPSYRTATIQLTDEQIDELKCRFSYSTGENEFYEEISRAIIE